MSAHRISIKPQTPARPKARTRTPAGVVISAARTAHEHMMGEVVLV